MAGSLLHSRRGGRRGRGRRGAMSDINVTPFVDVMLVLLIVFMVTAPLLTVGVPLDLPRTRAQNIADPVEPLVVSVDRQGVIFVQEREVGLEQVVPLLRAITENNPEARIFIRGDQALTYGTIMKVMGEINSAGFTRVALIAELPDE